MIWHIMALVHQVHSSLERCEGISDIAPYLAWKRDLDDLLSPERLRGQLGAAEFLFSKTAPMCGMLAICADQVRKAEARPVDPEFLSELNIAVSELFRRVEVATSIDEASRRALLRLIQALSRAIDDYRVFGSEGLRSAAEAMLGGFVLQRQGVEAVVKNSPEDQSLFKKVLSGVAKLFEQVKPAAEAANSTLEVWEKLSQISGPS